MKHVKTRSGKRHEDSKQNIYDTYGSNDKTHTHSRRSATTQQNYGYPHQDPRSEKGYYTSRIKLENNTPIPALFEPVIPDFPISLDALRLLPAPLIVPLLFTALSMQQCPPVLAPTGAGGPDPSGFVQKLQGVCYDADKVREELVKRFKLDIGKTEIPENMGDMVREYMKGIEGSPYCAAAATKVAEDVKPGLLPYTRLVSEAKNAARERDALVTSPERLPERGDFLFIKLGKKWHMGVVEGIENGNIRYTSANIKDPKTGKEGVFSQVVPTWQYKDRAAKGLAMYADTCKLVIYLESLKQAEQGQIR